jgi:predicted Zn finger-like uncharacterized protein
MHSVNCPSCDTRIEVDFLPVAGLVSCPNCQRTFSARQGARSSPQETERPEKHTKQNGSASGPGPAKQE